MRAKNLNVSAKKTYTFISKYFVRKNVLHLMENRIFKLSGVLQINFVVNFSNVKLDQKI